MAYGRFGLYANVALLTNLVLIAAALSLLQATLTLPGIAGIVLTIGMAVDANVLIFERIREEVRAGRTPLSAIDTGYRRALTTIIDSNLTTFIAALLLFLFGSGPVQGFGVTLSIGLATSMFTAIMVTRPVAFRRLGGGARAGEPCGFRPCSNPIIVYTVCVDGGRLSPAPAGAPEDRPSGGVAMSEPSFRTPSGPSRPLTQGKPKRRSAPC